MTTARGHGDGDLVERKPRGVRLAAFLLLASIPTMSIPAGHELQQAQPETWFHPSDRVSDEFLSSVRGAGLPVPVAVHPGPVLVPRKEVGVILWDEHSKLPPAPSPTAPQKVNILSQPGSPARR
jgi:hypothetical protein